MFVLRGVPINDFTTKTNVGTSASAIDITMELSYAYSAPALSGISVVNNSLYNAVTTPTQVGVSTVVQTETTG
jgi:hypothetical protein